ncbi:MAG TPA: carboxypeptidase-like regulatory domain-containing protein [Bacteroidales bacterium]|nr:carboxypeptidase-like regulatory domain-containing protein [Bacteroidales bacterium]
MKIALTFTLLIISITSYSQKIILGTIDNRQTGLPLQYVNVGFIDRGIGTVSKIDGTFLLKVNSDLSSIDSLLVSMIGYKSQKYSIDNLFSDTLKILLEPETFSLKEIIIKPKNIKNIGSISTSKKLGIYWGSQSSLGGEVGIPLKIKEKSSKINGFKLHVITNNWDSIKYRLHVYSIKDGLPCEDYLKQNRFISIKDSTGIVSFDLSDFNIIVDSDVILSLELLETFGNEDGLIRISAGLTGNVFSRYASQDKWTKNKGVHLGMETQISY